MSAGAPVMPGQQIPPDQAQPDPSATQSQDPTADNPQQKTPEESASAVQLTALEQEKLMQLRREYKTSWAPDRRAKVRGILRAFEVLKNKPYSSFDPQGFQFYDPIQEAITGGADPRDLDLYRYNNNIYQMLALSFMAALSPQVPKTRWMPENADDELDISTATNDSRVMAHIERKNKIKSLQKQELLHLWTGGCYFSYVRHIVDADRAGVTKEPIYQPVEQQVLPDRFVCEYCGAVTEASAMAIFRKPMCPQCNCPLSESDYYPAESMPIPTEVGKWDRPNGMVLLTSYGAVNVDAAPYAMDLLETPIIDLEIEVDVSSVRSAYPKSYSDIQATGVSGGEAESDADRTNRMQIFSTGSGRSGYLSNSMCTYSRCWFHPWAFDRLDDQEMAKGLKAKFPKGCKLVVVNGSKFLEAVPAKLSDSWTWCGTVQGIGLYPFAVGEAALDIQERINDVANIVHEHMDRNASPTVLADSDVLDVDALNGKPILAGTITPVKRRGTAAARSLSDLIFQPTFHVDNNIYTYGADLIQLAQLVSGVLPQIFGGSDKNVRTAAGQQQMLNTALGRLSLFWDQIREEHAERGENAVKCFADNMDDEFRDVIESDSESGFENITILKSQLQGSAHAYPESDQGFPASFAEIRDRIMELLQDVNNPFVQEFMEDPDNWKVVARYVAPPDVKLPGDDERSKIKRILSQLAQSDPMETVNPVTQQPLMLPSIMPDKDFDDMKMIVTMAKAWGQKHYQLMYTDPSKFNNVRAYLRLAAQYDAENQAAQAVNQVAAGPPPQAQGKPGASAPKPPQ